MSQQKCCIFKSIWRIFKNVFLAERRGRWLLWLTISSVQTFCFWNSNVTTFPTTRKCKNFNFSLHTVQAEMLNLRKYLTNLKKLSFAWKMRKVAIVVENFKCTDILLFSSNVTTFPISRKCKNFNFSLYTVQQKCYNFKSF